MLINGSALNGVLLDAAPFSEPVSRTARFISSTELARITTGTAYAVYARVLIDDAAGVTQDYSRRSNINWIHSLEYAGDIDAPIGTATVRLKRAVGAKSLAPFRSDSSYNSSGPSIDAGRPIAIHTASIALGATPTDADWRVVFEGTIDSVDWGQDPIVLECRDKGAQLQDVWFPGPGFVNASDSTDTIQATLQKLIDALGVTVQILLYVPVLPDPEVFVGLFSFDTEPGFDALTRLQQINGWDLRFRWSDADQTFRLTSKDPGRLRTDVDYTIGPDSYIDIKTLKIDRIPVRNEIWIEYRPDNDPDVDRVMIEAASDGISQNRYYKRTMVLKEGDDSPINTLELAIFFGQLILFDLSEPLAEQQVEMSYFWPVELHNRIRFPANSVHSDDDLDLSIVRYRHVLSDTETRTILDGRGKPAGSYWSWLTRRPSRPVGDDPTSPPNTTSPSGFAAMLITPDFATDFVRLDWSWGGDPTAEFEVFVLIGSSYISQGSVGTTKHFTWASSFDIEPFRAPPDDPQRAISFSFHVVATVSGVEVATSPNVSASYGNGP